MLKEFRTFLLRGNVVDLAVAVVIGAAFSSVVTAMVEDLVTPLIAAIGGQPDFSRLTFTINHSQFTYGHFINAVVSFMIISAVIFFFIVKPMNVLLARFQPPPTPAPAMRDCPECLSQVPEAARRCAFCTVELAQVAAPTTVGGD